MSYSVRSREGFTLIEILVALFIVALIGGVTTISVIGYVKSSRLKATKFQLKSFKQAIQNYNMELGEYPKTLDDLITKPADEKLAARWIPMLEVKFIPKDSWQQPYIYQLTPGGAHDFELYSEGPDKKTKIDVWAE